MKEELKFAISEIYAGYVEGWQLLGAIIAAPFVVCKEFILGTGRWAVHTGEARADSAGDPPSA